jgi:hypothetical protein
MELRDFTAISVFSIPGVLLRIGLEIGFGSKIFFSNITSVNVDNDSTQYNVIYYDFFSNLVGCCFMGALVQYTKERPQFKSQ